MGYVWYPGWFVASRNVRKAQIVKMTGTAHANATLLLTLPCIYAAYRLGGKEAAIGAGAGCVIAIWVNPDLDQEGLSQIEWTTVKRTFGLGFLWLLFWWPYAVGHSHRGMSHVPVLGTAVRLFYIALFIPVYVGLGVLFVKLIPILDVRVALRWPTIDWTSIPWLGLGWGVAALAASDALHWFCDLFSSQ